MIGRELQRLGYIRQLPEKFNALVLTQDGMTLLKERKPVRLTAAVTAPPSKDNRNGDIACDQLLLERLVELRSRLANEQELPPHILLSDVSLRQIARDYPTKTSDFAAITGMGERKTREFGALLLQEIKQHLETNPRQLFADTSFNPARRSSSNAARVKSDSAL